jgi:KUP system potassium uptake protein
VPRGAHSAGATSSRSRAAGGGGARHAGGRRAAHAGVAALTLGALGVVFGDIGTSPLYALRAAFSADAHAVKPVASEVYGLISLVFWAITMVVSVKYVSFIMRADNDGEGGIMALTAMLQRLKFDHARTKLLLIALGILGASLFYGDGAITPAISVLSAVEGLRVAEPSVSSSIVPIAIAVLCVLFAVERFGTGLVGRFFGPVMLVWFAVIGAVGAIEVVQHPAILRALSPSYGVQFFAAHPEVAFLALGSVVLAVTGAEALYADMGHFGRGPVRRAWFGLVFGALTLNYLGQGSLILRSPRAARNPFYLLLPHWATLPMVVLATIATVIASQAVISGAFSVTRQAVALGFLPRVTIRHTSKREGQVYVPSMNWILLATVIAIVVGFGSSTALASAYGVAVTGTFLLNTTLFLVVARKLWNARRPLIVLGAVVFGTIELAFFAANLTKVVHGGWLPLALAAIVFVVLMTWRRGSAIVTANRSREEGPLADFVAEIHRLGEKVSRVPGTAVFLNSNPQTTPLALRANVEQNHVLHENVVLMSLQTAAVPHIVPADRIVVDDAGFADDGITRLVVSFGFQDAPNVPLTLAAAAKAGQLERGIKRGEVTYFLSKMTIVITDAPGMVAWRKHLFLTLAHNAASPSERFHLPERCTVTIGAHIDI